jgi:hypothetical protein
VRVAGRLRDARLSLGCVTSRGDPVGFAWVDPHPGTRWIVVDDGRSAEIYRALGWLPIRVTTRNVDLARSSATFDVTEYGASGDVMVRYGVVARVAG